LFFTETTFAGYSWIKGMLMVCFSKINIRLLLKRISKKPAEGSIKDHYNSYALQLNFKAKNFKQLNLYYMKNSRMGMCLILSAAIIMSSCSSLTKTQKGAGVGVVAGGAMGAVIGKVSGNTALGAIIGAAVGGATGAVIGHKMDKQAEEIKKTVPDAKVERVGEGIVVEFSSNILFAFDKSSLSAEAKTNLVKLVTVLNTYPDTDIEVQGHSDNQGSDAYNMKLSERRAGAVSAYLKSKGISGNRITIKGFGETQPKYDNNTDDGRTQNRRVEFLITANEKMKAEAAKEASK
jgi:outer membrane protein OmpA-like peptidoglycan-associated protein